MTLTRSIRETVSYSGLIKQLVIRDLRLRYERSVLGFLWTLLNPLVMIGVYTFVFSVVLNSSTRLFPVFLVSVLLPWNFLVRVLLSVAPLPLQSGYLLNRAVFPTEALVFSGVLSALVEFLIEMAIFTVLLLAFGIPLTPGLYILPLAILIHVLFVTGVALFFSVAYVYYRDTQYLTALLTTAWFFMTPVFYPVSAVPAVYQRAYSLNPMVHIAAIFRLPVYNVTVPTLSAILVAAAIGLGTFVCSSDLLNCRSLLLSKMISVSIYRAEG
jgi:ABC-type polysaccharide/polyol phosphate export permease